MGREYFTATERIGFSIWRADDLPLAAMLWGNPEVSRYICASGAFTQEEIASRLNSELENFELYDVQYWPIFYLESGDIIGCCGLRPHGAKEYELGFHLQPEYWHQGLAREAAERTIEYAFRNLHAEALFAGHNPDNIVSKYLLQKLGFGYIGDEFYEPTGLYHPSYRLVL